MNQSLLPRSQPHPFTHNLSHLPLSLSITLSLFPFFQGNNHQLSNNLKSIQPKQKIHCQHRLSTSCQKLYQKANFRIQIGLLELGFKVFILLKNPTNWMLWNQDFNKTIENYTYNINKVIGKGAFSTVYLGQSNITGEAVAIKVINLGSLTMDSYQKLQYELAILKSLPHHPNIVRMLSLLQTSNNVYIVTEHCEIKLSDATNLDNVAMAVGIIEGLKHLYINNIVHRDIKPDNILLKNGVPKLIDFGFAKTISGPYEMMNEHLGTPLYMAPQMLDTVPYTSRCDIWSLGTTLHELVFKIDPYKARDIQDLRMKIKMTRPAIFMGGYNDPLSTLIKKCLIPDENRRMSWEELFAYSDQLRYSKSRPQSAQSMIQYNNQAMYQSPTPLIPIAYY